MSRSAAFRRRALPWLFCLLPLGASAADELLREDSGRLSLDFAEQMLNDRSRYGYRKLQELAMALDKASRESSADERLLLLTARAQLAIFGSRGQHRATQLLDQVLQKNPRHPYALVLRGTSEALDNCPPCARRSLDEAQRLAPEEPEVLEALGHFNVREGWRIRSAANAARREDKGQDYYGKALEFFERAVKVQPSPVRRAGILANVFEIQSYRKHYGQADLTMRKAIQAMPDSPDLRERYANFLIYRRGDWVNGALQAREALLQRGSDQAKITEALALYMLWSKSYESARNQPGKAEDTARQLDAARKAWPDTDEIFLYATSAESTAPIARAMLQAGLYTSAKGDYRDKDGDTPLGNAILNYGRGLAGDEAREEDDKKDFTALLALIDQLLADGANPNAHTSQGDTLLGAAVRTGDSALFQRLLKAGANPHQPGRLGVTPLMAAASLPDAEKGRLMAAQLLERGVDIHFYDRPKRNALMYAAGSGNTGLMAELLKRGARPAEKDEDGNTALDWAASAGHTKAAELLLAAGAEVTAHETACGNSDSADYARSGGHEDLARLLRSKRKSSL
ncbi:hypothetical protein AZSI13_11790 [Azospira sp. I13]|uniref:ankyrin repeat domain-containing protein n=1 Tax=Azospira sp. I13 TaxID=1765050 RepID=UPI000D4ADE4F|nr:ankyrin repeat domain-containing protein [Azospira sp. I13]GBG01852.1 hypothetical protein AZSI13_11790 [Azospira sp. I13]